MSPIIICHIACWALSSTFTSFFTFIFTLTDFLFFLLFFSLNYHNRCSIIFLQTFLNFSYTHRNLWEGCRWTLFLDHFWWGLLWLLFLCFFLHNFIFKFGLRFLRFLLYRGCFEHMIINKLIKQWKIIIFKPKK